MSAIGMTCEYPPPAAPPFTPNTGPRLGSRMQRIELTFSRRSACVRPTETVLFPSPAGVGLMAVTSTSRPRPFCCVMAIGSFALYLPYCSRSSGVSPMSRATSTIGRGVTLLAISMSDGTVVATRILSFLIGGLRRSNSPTPARTRRSRGSVAALVRRRRDEAPAKPAFDAEVAGRDGVVERRGRLDDLAVLHVQRQRAADAAVRTDRIRRRLTRFVPVPGP